MTEDRADWLREQRGSEAKPGKRVDSRSSKPFTTLVEDGRKALVKAYRAHPSSWPDGIDSNKDDGDHWYRGHEAEWLDDGTYIGPVTKVDSDVTKVDSDVTKVASIVTKVDATSPDVTKVAHELVEGHMGRPAVGEQPMTDAERKRRQRERLAAARAVIKLA